MTVDVLMPHAVIRVRFLTTAEGGRKTAIQGVREGIQDVKYGCPVYLNGQAFDCRFWPFAAGGYELGQEYDIPIRFLYPERAMKWVSPGAPVTLWEGKTIAVGQVLTIDSRELSTSHGPAGQT
ncbi:hypothetical protein Pan44_31310 [Caulifigura coniformis]|uniref:Uncharacterized protein n=1 Tax=Caulifigura coniformis TaxID=2527983 RepID=A0A517SG60_9PLAN|nr:hypothetical protein [Caulifigura coniformis]QDT55090.1 hypothetical protein Pan44_31310 [Caulifigura coniformis]